ncbi:M16 family metallopeptidase [Neisseria iguanae]|uniref:Insulinase family protein n=1 Tax=Neisseria iguanae TaxID=90242 RepID=A0A2P7U250_9NEIS|nr:pitrilysin family protein [Neisseria iguanae]PSJ81015.1 insulinase family protein [Neisseria iguanae]
MHFKTFILALAALPLTTQAAVDIQRWTTSEGTQILLVERRENPIVDMKISFKGAGSVFNPQGKSQVAEFTAALLTDGTKTLDEEAFNEKANDIAANIGSDSGHETATISFRSLSKAKNLKQTVALVNESLTAPRFDPAVFARRQKQAVTALQQQETAPDFTAGRAFTKLAYPSHPYGKDAYVTVDSLKAVTLDDIRAFHRTHYGKNNAVVAIVGDVSRRQAEKMVQTALKGLPQKSRADSSIAPVDKQTAQRRDIPFAGEQAQIILGMPLIKRHDPDYYALVAGNYILGGGGFDSRLMKRLRDQKGYTYGVYSSLVPLTEAGVFRIGYSTQKKNTRASLADVRAVVEQFIAEGPTEAELEQAKANIIGSFPLRFDSNAKLLDYLSLIGVHNLESSYLEDYPKAVGRLTTAQIKDAWQRRVKFSDLHIVVVGAQ